MGKWTASYYDDVLHHKLKTLVLGSIHRTALEKVASEPKISFEDFIEDLDTGDSFTATVIDILVKELADRRHRPVANEFDKRCISERTARALRGLGPEGQIFRARRVRRVASEVPQSPTTVEAIFDDEDFDGFLDASGGMEGVQENALHDAYPTQVQWRDDWSSPDPIALESLTGGPDPVPVTMSPRPSLLRRNMASHANSLSRQPSIRRPPNRARTVDFNEFTSRRRSSARGADAHFVDLAELLHADVPPSRASSSQPPPQRRFFPIGRTSRRSVSREMEDEILQSRQSPWIPSLSRQSSVDRDGAPRLRRGVVRAPESMLSRHASPLPPALPSPVSLADTPTAAEGDQGEP